MHISKCRRDHAQNWRGNTPTAEITPCKPPTEPSRRDDVEGHPTCQPIRLCSVLLFCWNSSWVVSTTARQFQLAVFCWDRIGSSRWLHKDVLHKAGDEYYVFVVSDADLGRYGISPSSWNKILMQVETAGVSPEPKGEAEDPKNMGFRKWCVAAGSDLYLGTFTSRV